MTREGSHSVLVIEDEREVRRFLQAALESQGFRVFEAETAKDGIAQAATRTPDVILLDLGLPDGDGRDVTRRLREWSKVPILVLSARHREQDKIDALDAGADDYLTKPFSVGELLARVRVALRRAVPPDVDPTVVVGPLSVDLAAHRVELSGHELHVTPIEFKLLAVLARHAGKVVTHRQLLQEVWGPAATSQTQYLRVHMGALRRKIEPNAARPLLLLTEPGVGYRLRAE